MEKILDLIRLLKRGEDIISGIEAAADNAGVDLEEARQWWQEVETTLERTAEHIRNGGWDHRQDRVYTERGNVALTNGESSVLWLMSEDGAHTEVTYSPCNYPAWQVVTNCSIQQDELVRHINNNLMGWNVQKANVDGVNIDEDGKIRMED